MFEASPGAIVVVSLGMRLMMRWLDGLTDPPKPEETTAWRPMPVAAATKVRDALALPAPSLVLAPQIPVERREKVELVREAAAPAQAMVAELP